MLKITDSNVPPVGSQTAADFPRSIDTVLARAIEAIIDHNGVSN